MTSTGFAENRASIVYNHSKTLNKTAETPLSQATEIDTPSPLNFGVGMDVSGDNINEFWMASASKIDEPTTPKPLSRQRLAVIATTSRSNMETHGVEMKISDPLVDVIAESDSDVDSASTCSYSVLSDDTVEPPPPPRLIRFTRDEEFAFFNNIYHILDASFAKWEEKVNYQSGVPLSLEEFEDAFIPGPNIYASPVIFGRRPDLRGFWKGRIDLRGEYIEIRKLRAPSFENWIGFGVKIGSIEDFESMGGAVLFMGVDRQMYYTDRDGWFDLDEFGRYCYGVIGPYDFRDLSKDKILDPGLPLA